MFLLSAFLVGFLGSFHCAGMCGPIALALPGDSGSGVSLFISRLLYNGGRTLTYTALGLMVGFLGHRIALAGFQKTLSVLCGAIIILIVIVTFFYPRLAYINPTLNFYSQKLKSVFRKLFGKKSKSTLFFIGTVNGLLPCGFVYLALAAAASMEDLIKSGSYMALFGAGTLPMMMVISLTGNIFGMKLNKFVRKLSPYIALIVAAFLIYRGIFIQGNCCNH